VTNLGDRRTGTRMEVVGVLWATLDVITPVKVVNLSATGVLIETEAPAPVGSPQFIQFVFDRQIVGVETRVCHLQDVLQATAAPTYLIGLEFVSPTAEALRGFKVWTAPPDQNAP
jgi:PilZ domain-containing protein